ncbi:MAG: FtsX-like permease family protein [Bacteroidales bacterium]|nr:FtsX-like permease family protein [Bacteroidales bacterium]
MIKTALRFIKYDRVKSLGVIIGIVISIFLIGQQVGILRFLQGLMGGLVSNSRTDLAQVWVVDNITRNSNELAFLDGSLVNEVRSAEGVEEAWGVIAAGANAKFPNGKSSPVLIIGSEPPLFVAAPRQEKIIDGDLLSLIGDEAVSAEYFDRQTFDYPVGKETRMEINGKTARIKVQTRDARGFAGSFIYTTLSRARFYASLPESSINAVAVKIRSGFTPGQVADNINRIIPNVRAWNAETLRKSTVSYITLTSNIGTSIGSLVIFAVISGFFIIGLTLYSAAVDHIRDYGTLKAIGATNGYITRLILTQSLIFAVAGFFIAAMLLEGFRLGVSNSGLMIRYSPAEYIILFTITLFISIGSSLFFSIRTINKVEPASVFRT